MTVPTTSPQFIEQRAALFAAVEKGDISAIEELFTRHDGLCSQVERTERYMRRELDQDEAYPWYCMPPSPLHPEYQNKNIFAFAVSTQQYEVLEWLFSSERVPVMGTTLASVWLTTAERAMDTDSVEMLELMLAAGPYIFSQNKLQT